MSADRVSGSILFLAPHPGITIAGDEFAAGVGGTVAAVILMAETLVERGWDVRVASGGLDRAAKYNGVWYGPAKEATDARYDAVVLVNSWDDVVHTLSARRRVFLYFDTRPGASADTLKCVDWADVITVQSSFGKEVLRRALPNGAHRRVAVMPIPIRLEDYRPDALKAGHRLLYSSMPDRGLVHLSRLFPMIKAQVRDAELHITGDFTMYGWPSGRAGYERMFAMIPGVHYHGQVERAELVELQRSASVLAYPCTFKEGFCIAAAEAMAAGAVPVTSGAFALATTVGSAGVLIPGHPGGGRLRLLHRWWYYRRFVREVVRLLADPHYWQTKAAACRQSAAERFSPAAWYAEFRRYVI